MASGLSVDVENEFNSVLEEVRMLSAVLPGLRADRSRDEAQQWIVITGVAAAITSIYTGCERIMALLAKHVDGSAIDGADGGWHRVMLNRMSNPFPGIRDAIISETCHEGLDRFRSFRHRQRSTYGITLDAEIVLERAEELSAVFQLFHDEVRSFLEHWPDA